MLKINKDNLGEFIEAFNKAVKNLKFETSGDIEISINPDNPDGSADFLIHPSNLQKSLGITAHYITLPSEFDIENIESISEIDGVFHGENKSYMCFMWDEDNRTTYLEVSPYYVDFGQGRISYGDLLFNIQLACRPKTYTD